jgi:hypothetical protein
MSLENKKSSLYTSNNSVKVVKNYSAFGSLFKAPNPISDLEKTAIFIDGGEKSKVSKTVPVDQLPQKEVPKEVFDIEPPVIEDVPKKEEIIEVLEPITPTKLSNSGSKLSISPKL